jgi:alpha-ketoglutarate-dependent taurine dioxygenase
MKETQIHSGWGTQIEFENPLDFFKQDFSFWRNMIYDRKLIVFKRMNFSMQDYVKLCSHFGMIWSAKDYEYSLESVENIKVGNRQVAVSPISNKISPKLGLSFMPWHSDIPNKKIKPFPHRTLWMVSNPNPESGLTTWLNIEDGLNRLPDNLKSQIDDIKIIQQSWYQQGTEVQEFNFLKVHPITGKTSLRLNYYCVPEEDINDAWIKKVKYKNTIMDPKPILSPFYKFLETQQDLLYTHKWDDFDIVIYDNWPFVHNRTQLDFDPSLERKFYRTNIDHINDRLIDFYEQSLKRILAQ